MADFQSSHTGQQWEDSVFVQVQPNLSKTLYRRDETMCGPAGVRSIDFSYSDEVSTNGSTGNYSFCSGYNTKSGGENSVCFGKGTISQNYAQVAFGRYNIGTDINTVLEVGVGIDDLNKKNALEIYTDGTLTAPESTPALTQARGLQTLVPISYLLSSEFGNSLPTSSAGLTPGQIWNNAGVLSIA